jgi:hypothetical protein
MSEHRAVTTEDLAQDNLAQETQERDPEFRESSAYAEPETGEIPEQHEPDAVSAERTDESRLDESRPDESRPDESRSVESRSVESRSEESERTQLFDHDDTDRFRENWRSLQSDFVDDPKRAVQQADELVAEVMQTLASTFADHKRTLEEQWSGGGEAQTEDLRLALQQYRVFFQQLLAV